MNWELFAWAKRGPRRKEVLELLSNSKNPMTANDVKLKLKIAMAQSSFTLKELSQKKLIECLNPKDNIGKLYKIKKEGKEIINGI